MKKEITDYRPQRPQRGCSLSGAFNTTEQIKDCVTIMHAPAGCAAINLSNRFSTAYHRYLKGEAMPKGSIALLITTNLNEQDVIFGGTDALRAAIKEAAKFSPQLIAIITACVVGVIGDDVHSIAEEMQQKLSAKILAIESDGFLTGGFYTGIDNAYYALLKDLVEPPKQRYDNRVNILGEKNLSTEADFNFREMQRLINQFGMEVHTRFVRNTTTAQIKRLTEARVNIIRDMDIGLWPAQYLQAQFGMEFFDKPFPLGRLATIEWLRTFGKMINKTDEAEKIIESENQIFIQNLERIGESIEGKTAIVSGTGDFCGLVDIAFELGLRIIQANIVGKVDDETSKILNSFFECRVSNVELRENWDKVVAEVNKLRPNFCLSTVRLPNAEDGVAYASLPIVAPIGFNGALRFAREWVWEIQHPFREGWRK
jgi:nitrogenase molybdenum-iron protein alpha/beta subunit